MSSKNFAKVTVAAGYDASATSIALSSGHGAKCPTLPAPGVWWNATDYTDPSDDPNVETISATARTDDTLTIARAQEGSSAAAHNSSGKTYKIHFGITAASFDAKVGSEVQTLSGVATVYTITHTRNTENIVAQLLDTTTGEITDADCVVIDAATVEIRFDYAPTSGQYQVRLIG